MYTSEDPPDIWIGLYVYTSEDPPDIWIGLYVYTSEDPPDIWIGLYLRGSSGHMDRAVCAPDTWIGLYVCVHLRILQTYGLIAMTYKIELYREWCIINCVVHFHLICLH